jgi:hypothetical protein
LEEHQYLVELVAIMVAAERRQGELAGVVVAALGEKLESPFGINQ